MLPTISARLPGVPVLQSQCTGPEYSRWRRSIKFALETRDLWKYCNGKCPMPMPEAGLNALPPTASTINLQHSLLDERRAWVKQDREVKLDIFLSLAEETMQEVFEVGPPLPPSNLNAQQMIRTLDRRYGVFKFEAYHHAFCHFLNLHVDQFSTIHDFNEEFSTTLEDLVDHGQPIPNIQACSAYLSKLRCTHNPWVVKMLEEWDTQHRNIGVLDLIKESPQWFLIRPLAPKISQAFCIDGIPEEHLEDGELSDSDFISDSSTASTGSSLSLHSRQASNTTVQSVELRDIDVKRQMSTATANSLEITIHASEDIAEIDPDAFRRGIKQLPPSAIPKRGSSKNQVPGTLLTDGEPPDWLSAKKSIARRPLPPPPHNRPLPDLPTPEQQAQRNTSHERSLSSRSSPAQEASVLQLPTTHPALRQDTSLADTHPVLRPTVSSPINCKQESRPVRRRPSPPPLDTTAPPPTSSLTLAIPWPSTPDLLQRPHSSRAILPATQAPNPHPSYAQEQPETPTSQQPPQLQEQNDVDDLDGTNKQFEVQDKEDEGRERKLSTTSSTLSLPLQGTHDSAWTYLYESKGGYLLQSPPREHSVSPLDSESELNNHGYNQRRRPTYEDTIIVPAPMTLQLQSKSTGHHLKSSSLDFVARLSGDSGFSSTEKGGQRKKKTWSLSAGIGKFSTSKGVKEII